MKSLEQSEFSELSAEIMAQVDEVISNHEQQRRDDFWRESWRKMNAPEKIWIITFLFIPAILRLLDEKKPLSPHAFILMVGRIVQGDPEKFAVPIEELDTNWKYNEGGERITYRGERVKFQPTYSITRGGVTFAVRPDGTASFSYDYHVTGKDKQGRTLYSEESLRGREEIGRIVADKTLASLIVVYLIGNGRS